MRVNLAKRSNDDGGHYKKSAVDRLMTENSQEVEKCGRKEGWVFALVGPIALPSLFERASEHDAALHCVALRFDAVYRQHETHFTSVCVTVAVWLDSWRLCMHACLK